MRRAPSRRPATGGNLVAANGDFSQGRELLIAF
jgi:hypothetical protein